METGDLRSVNEEVLLAYWHNEYERGIEKNGFGRQGHGSILFVLRTFRFARYLLTGMLYL